MTKYAKLYYLIQPVDNSKLVVWTDIDGSHLTTINGVRHASRPAEKPPYWVLKIDPRWPLSYYHQRIHDVHELAVRSSTDVVWHRIWDRKPHPDSVMPAGPEG